jgi:membrane-bound lytic murein transglycosylase D
MKHMTRFLSHFAGLAVLAVLVSACSSTPEVKREKLTLQRPPAYVPQKPKTTYNGRIPASYGGTFPKQEGMEPAVDFWRKTYAVWSRSDAAIHDDRYLDVVYEVVRIPGPVSEGLTQDQKDFIAQRKEFWKGQLAELDSKLRYGAELNAGDKQVIALMESSGRPITVLLPGAADRVRSQRGTRERFLRGLELSGRYDLQFRKIFRDAGLPEDLAYLPHVESSFQVGAKSSAGAVGLWQFTKAAAQTFMPGHESAEDRMDPYISAYGAARYLTSAHRKLGNWPSAVTSYNHGIGGMNRAQNQVGTDFVRIVDTYSGPAFGFASRNYYAQFLAAREIAQQPELFFPEGIRYEAPVESGQFMASE